MILIGRAACAQLTVQPIPAQIQARPNTQPAARVQSIKPLTLPFWEDFSETRNGQPDGELATERRYYPERDTMTTEAGIRMGFLSNLHLTGGEGDGSGAFPVRLTHHPLAMWIWSGAFIMALGGFVSLSDRRFRVGAPHRVRAGDLTPASA